MKPHKSTSVRIECLCIRYQYPWVLKLCSYNTREYRQSVLSYRILDFPHLLRSRLACSALVFFNLHRFCLLWLLGFGFEFWILKARPSSFLLFVSVGRGGVPAPAFILLSSYVRWSSGQSTPICLSCAGLVLASWPAFRLSCKACLRYYTYTCVPRHTTPKERKKRTSPIPNTAAGMQERRERHSPNATRESSQRSCVPKCRLWCSCFLCKPTGRSCKRRKKKHPNVLLH
jgi:hypothetical protein